MPTDFSKATPRPWTAEDKGGKGAWIKGSNDDWSALSCGTSDETADANAALIVAAVNAYGAGQADAVPVAYRHTMTIAGKQVHDAMTFKRGHPFGRQRRFDTAADAKITTRPLVYAAAAPTRAGALDASTGWEEYGTPEAMRRSIQEQADAEAASKAQDIYILATVRAEAADARVRELEAVLHFYAGTELGDQWWRHVHADAGKRAQAALAAGDGGHGND